MNKGLWSILRHPNYLGEIVFWLGLFLFVPAGGLGGEALFSAVGFIAMVLLIKLISIPMMEKQNLSQRKGYSKYIKRVPQLFPFKF